MIAQTATINAARRASLIAELDRIGLSPDGVQMMLDGITAAHSPLLGTLAAA